MGLLRALGRGLRGGGGAAIGGGDNAIMGGGGAAQAMPSLGGMAPASRNAEALQGLSQRIRARGPEFGGDDIETYRSLLFYNAPGLRNNQRLKSAQSLDEIAQVLDEAGANPQDWLRAIGL